MLKIPPTPYQKRRRYKSREGGAAPAPPSAPLVLVSASYSASPRRVSMTFDRAIDSTNLNAGVFALLDGPGHKRYVGTAASPPVNPNLLVLNLVIDHVAFGAGVLLSVGADNGLVAQDDGGVWSGVEGLELPFP